MSYMTARELMKAPEARLLTIPEEMVQVYESRLQYCIPVQGVRRVGVRTTAERSGRRRVRHLNH